MVQRIEIPKVTTKDGEVQVTIAIELTVNLNSDGLIINAQTTNLQNKLPETKTKEDTKWAIPDFSNKKPIQFGKDK